MKTWLGVSNDATLSLQKEGVSANSLLHPFWVASTRQGHYSLQRVDLADIMNGNKQIKRLNGEGLWTIYSLKMEMAELNRHMKSISGLLFGLDVTNAASLNELQQTLQWSETYDEISVMSNTKPYNTITAMPSDSTLEYPPHHHHHHT